MRDPADRYLTRCAWCGELNRERPHSYYCSRKCADAGRRAMKRTQRWGAERRATALAMLAEGRSVSAVAKELHTSVKAIREYAATAP